MNIQNAYTLFQEAKQQGKYPLGIRRISWPDHYLYVTVNGFEDVVHVNPTEEMIANQKLFGRNYSLFNFRFQLNIEVLCANDWQLVY